MEIKAFNKICSEAEEAFADRRFFDALSLTEAIVKDLPPFGDNHLTDEIKKLHNNYCAILNSMMTPDAHKALLSKSEALFQQAFQLLQTARHRWACAHPEASTYAKTAGLFATITDDDIVLHLQNLNGLNEGEPIYYQQLDAAFNFLWCHQPDSLVYGPTLCKTLLSADCFVRRTLVGALLLSLLESFLPSKVELLIALGTPQEGDSEHESDDLQARVAVALAVICQRYSSVLELFPQDTQLIRAFFQRDYVQSHMETLLHAFTCQSLVDSVEHRVDDIMHIIRDTFEKVQPHLADNEDGNGNDNGNGNVNGNGNGNVNDNDNDNENHLPAQTDASNLKTDNGNEKGGFHIDIKQISFDSLKDEHLFDKLAEHARKVDQMRQSDLDINKPSFSFMKAFPFFRTPAHWFYPFSRLVPDIKSGITLPNGNPDLMTLAIMNANRFCDSDCYSYASMMMAVRARANDSFRAKLHEALEEMESQYTDLPPEAPQIVNLNPFTAYCQSLHRYFFDTQKEHSYLPFNPAYRHELPTLPIFKGLFTSSADLEASIDVCYVFGDSQQALALIDAAVEAFGVSLWLLQEQGDVFMQCKQWKRALSAYQQVRIFEDDKRTVSLSMARCYEALGQWHDALPLLQDELKLQLEESDEENPEPETLDLIEEIGRCLIQLSRWDEAVQHFFRLELLGRHLNLARRAIAWCSIHQGKYERACNYYGQLIQLNRATWEDHLNRGHALWLQGLTAEAINAYRESQTTFNRTPAAKRQHFAHWTEAFREDARTLLAQHFTAIDCALMLDAVAMKG